MKNTGIVLGTLCLIVGIGFYFYALQAPIPYGLNNDNFGRYHTLLYEQIIALKVERPKDTKNALIWDRYNTNFLEAQQFSDQINNYLKKFPEVFSDSEVSLITNKLDQGRPNSQTKNDLGTPVFHRFHGHWRGVWRQDGKDQIYDHDWFPPETLQGNNSDLIIQPVTMGAWDQFKKIRKKTTIAINGYNKLSGVILGAVGVIGNKSEAPHAGYYIDQNHLLWVASFATEQTERPYYSIYFERIQENKTREYLIDGVGFHWNRKTKKIELPHFKKGRYEMISSHQN